MPRDALTRFHDQLRLMLLTRSRVETIFAQQTIPGYHGPRLFQRDMEVTYEALFLRLTAGFESYLEELFFEIVGGHRAYPPKRRVAVLMTAATPKLLKEIVFEGKPYVDWLPFQERTIPRAKRFISEGRPFDDLDKTDRATISDVYTIRHAIAHRSESAQRKFLAVAKVQQALERTPAKFLRALVNAQDTRFQSYAVELARLSKELS